MLRWPSFTWQPGSVCHAHGSQKRQPVHHWRGIIMRRLRSGRHPPTQEDRVCKKCHELLPARWFGEHATNRSGRDGHCLACYAKRWRALSDRRRQTPEQKQCRRCGHTLTADCFHRDRASADGLRGICKECTSAHKKTQKQALIHVEVPTKLCSGCKVVKPTAEFSAKRQMVDGLNHLCKECNKRSALEWRQRQQQQQQQRQQQPPSLSAAHHGAAGAQPPGAVRCPVPCQRAVCDNVSKFRDS